MVTVTETTESEPAWKGHWAKCLWLSPGQTDEDASSIQGRSGSREEKDHQEHAAVVMWEETVASLCCLEMGSFGWIIDAHHNTYLRPQSWLSENHGTQ